MTPPPEVAPPKTKRSKAAIARDALQGSFAFVAGLDRPRVENDGATLVFRLPLSPWSVNSEVHWRGKEKIHDDYVERFRLLAALGKLPDLPGQPFTRATVRVSYYTKRHNDFDNLFSRTKVSFDCIKNAGYIVDDGPEHVRWSEPPRQFVYSWAAPYVVIRLTPVEEFEPLVDDEPMQENPADVLAAKKQDEREQRERLRLEKKAAVVAAKIAKAAEKEAARLAKPPKPPKPTKRTPPQSKEEKKSC